jgi:hypothetical protein
LLRPRTRMRWRRLDGAQSGLWFDGSLISPSCGLARVTASGQLMAKTHVRSIEGFQKIGSEAPALSKDRCRNARVARRFVSPSTRPSVTGPLARTRPRLPATNIFGIFALVVRFAVRQKRLLALLSASGLHQAVCRIC